MSTEHVRIGLPSRFTLASSYSSLEVGEYLYGFYLKNSKGPGWDYIFVVVDILTKFLHFFSIAID